MKDSAETLRPSAGDELVAPVTIFDAQGQVVRVMAAAEFRRSHPRLENVRYPMVATPRRSREGA
jgi:hypothetical protein